MFSLQDFLVRSKTFEASSPDSTSGWSKNLGCGCAYDTYASVTERQWHGKSGLGFNQIDVLIAFFRQSTLSRHPRPRNSTIIGRKSELLLHQTFSRRSDHRQDRLLRLPLLTARMMLSAQRKLPRKQTRVCIVTIQYWSVTFRYQVVWEWLSSFSQIVFWDAALDGYIAQSPAVAFRIVSLSLLRGILWHKWGNCSVIFFSLVSIEIRCLESLR